MQSRRMMGGTSPNDVRALPAATPIKKMPNLQAGPSRAGGISSSLDRIPRSNNSFRAKETESRSSAEWKREDSGTRGADGDFSVSGIIFIIGDRS